MGVFSMLLPSALLTWLLMSEAGLIVLGDRYAKLEGTQAWAAFLFASYLLRHLIFLMRSWLNEFCDLARRYALDTQIAPIRGGVAALGAPSANREAQSSGTAPMRGTS
jgi:hypothetical protein